MTDIRTTFRPLDSATIDGAIVADWAVADGDLERDAGLETAVLISLFTDARARAEDYQPDANGFAYIRPGEDPRGWWGESFWPGSNGSGGRQIGCRWWLRRRMKVTDETAQIHREDAEEALAWLLEDGVAAAVNVTAEWLEPRHRGVLIVTVRIVRPDGARQAFRFDSHWEAQLGRTGDWRPAQAGGVA